MLVQHMIMKTHPADDVFKNRMGFLFPFVNIEQK